MWWANRDVDASDWLQDELLAIGRMEGNDKALDNDEH